MTSKHIDEKSFTLNEHIAEQKRIHRQQMLERSPRPSSSLSTSSLNAILPNQGLVTTNQLQNQLTIPTTSGISVSATATPTTSGSGDDRSRSSTEESDSEEDILSDNSSSELDTETIGFLQPVSQKQRRALLKAAGVREIASSEKNECRDIRASREICGCSCRDYCDPETCLCSQSGIKCQVSFFFSKVNIKLKILFLNHKSKFFSRWTVPVFHVAVQRMVAVMCLVVLNSIQNVFERISYTQSCDWNWKRNKRNRINKIHCTRTMDDCDFVRATKRVQWSIQVA